MDSDILANGIEALAERERGIGMALGALIALGALFFGGVLLPAVVSGSKTANCQ